MERFHAPIMDKFFAVGFLHLRGDGRIGAPLPAQIVHFGWRTDVRCRVAMAIEAKAHAQRLGMIDLVHLVNAPVTFHATEPARDMHRMVEINVIRHDVDLHPRDRLAGRRAFADEREARVILQNLTVAVHAGGRRRDVREPGFVHAGMAVTAIHAHLPRVDRVGKRHRLDRLVADPRVLGRAINRHTRSHRAAHQREADGNQERYLVGPLRENHGNLKITRQNSRRAAE